MTGINGKNPLKNEKYGLFAHNKSHIWPFTVDIMTSYLICIKPTLKMLEKIGAVSQKIQLGLKNKFPQRKQNVHEMPTGNLISTIAPWLLS